MSVVASVEKLRLTTRPDWINVAQRWGLGEVVEDLLGPILIAGDPVTMSGEEAREMYPEFMSQLDILAAQIKPGLIQEK